MGILLGILFVLSVQPLMMISVIMGLSLFFSFLVYGEMASFWFGYIFLLIMLSGVLVVFTYMASLVPNESFGVLNFVGGVAMILILLGVMDFGLHIGGFYLKMGLDLWEGLFGVWNLFLVSFMFGVMLLVVYISNLKTGAVRGILF